MGLAELFEFRTETKGKGVETPWITEATEELMEDIIQDKYRRLMEKNPSFAEQLREEAQRVKEAAKSFIRFCRSIGGKPMVREYASRYFGTIDMACYFEDEAEIYSMHYWEGNLSMGTNKGFGSMKLPKGLDTAEIKIKKPKKVDKVAYTEYIVAPTLEASGVSGIKEISMDIYGDHVDIEIRSETIEEVIGGK